MCLSSPQPPWTPGPSGLCIPRCSVLGFNGRWVRKKEVCASLLSSLPLPQLQLFGFRLYGRGSRAVMWFSWSPGFPRSEPREEGRGSYCRWLTPFSFLRLLQTKRVLQKPGPASPVQPSVCPHSFCLRPGFCRISPEPSSTLPTLYPLLHLSSKLLPGESPQDFTSGSPPA